MTTFTLADSRGNEADPSVVTMQTPGLDTAGNYLLAVISERSGAGHATHTLSDDSSDSGSWTKLLGHDQELGDAGARQSMSVWARKVTAADVTDGTIILTADSTTTSVGTRLSLFEIAPNAAYDFTYADGSSADSGTLSASPTGSGTVGDTGGSNLFSFAVGSWRDGVNSPTSLAFDLADLDSGVTSFTGGTNARTHAIEFSATGVAAAAKATNVSWIEDVDSHECTCALLVFSDGAIGGGDPEGSLIAGKLIRGGLLTHGVLAR